MSSPVTAVGKRASGRARHSSGRWATMRKYLRVPVKNNIIGDNNANSKLAARLVRPRQSGTPSGHAHQFTPSPVRRQRLSLSARQVRRERCRPAASARTMMLKTASISANSHAAGCLGAPDAGSRRHRRARFLPLANGRRLWPSCRCVKAANGSGRLAARPAGDDAPKAGRSSPRRLRRR